MDSLIITTVAQQVAERSLKAVSSFYKTVPKTNYSIVIEVTSTDGKTCPLETITPNKPSTTQNILDTLAYHINTIWLFTYSDAKTVLLPWTLFGIGHALAASQLDLTINSSTLRILTRMPQVLAWLWLNLLPFAISNQNTESAILEDGLNKAWRPLPSRRISPTSATYLMLVSYLIAFLFSLRNGGVSQCVLIAICGTFYNKFGGSDKSVFTRHLLNAVGFISFGSGAMEVAFGRGFIYSELLIQWLRIIAFVVFTGIHTADMYDQEGDAQSNRRTLPLIIGDEAARYCTVISVLAWSIFCPLFWQLSIAGYILPVLGGVVVARRSLTKKDVKADKTTYKLWNLWLVAIYCLPLAKVIGQLVASS